MNTGFLQPPQNMFLTFRRAPGVALVLLYLENLAMYILVVAVTVI